MVHTEPGRVSRGGGGGLNFFFLRAEMSTKYISAAAHMVRVPSTRKESTVCILGAL